jgi:hypothetical protein
MSGPIPSPSTKGIIGLSGTLSEPFSIVIFSPAIVCRLSCLFLYLFAFRTDKYRLFIDPQLYHKLISMKCRGGGSKMLYRTRFRNPDVCGTDLEVSDAYVIRDLRRPLYHAAFRRNQSRAYRIRKRGIVDRISQFVAESRVVTDIKLHIQDKPLVTHTLLRQLTYNAIDL